MNGCQSGDFPGDDPDDPQNWVTRLVDGLAFIDRICARLADTFIIGLLLEQRRRKSR